MDFNLEFTYKSKTRKIIAISIFLIIKKKFDLQKKITHQTQTIVM